MCYEIRLNSPKLAQFFERGILQFFCMRGTSSTALCIATDLQLGYSIRLPKFTFNV